MSFVVVDIEACERVQDWAQPWKAGVSCAVTYHPTELFKIWQPDQLSDLVAYLNAADLVVGYAIEFYDLPVLSALTSTEITTPTYDLCALAAKGVKRRVKLDEVLGATLALAKSGKGADAPSLWQEGRLTELHAYCVNDVLLEYLLFRYARDHGYLLVEDRGRLIACPCPPPESVSRQ